MSETQQPGMETRRRLLEVACEMFAEVGYEQTTLALISTRAKANKASINYHFRSKEALYQECWRLILRRSNEAHPPQGGVPADAPAEERLRGRVRSILARMADRTRSEFQLVFREIANPTGLLSEIMSEFIEPMYAGFAAVVAELLGPKATDLHRDLCLRSILGQCMDLMAMEQRRAAAPPSTSTVGPPRLNADLETVADHITRFSLAGIRETRRFLESTADASGAEPSRSSSGARRPRATR